MVPLDRALVSSYRLTIVTMPLTEVVWPQFAMQVFGVHLVPLFGRNGGLNWYHRVETDNRFTYTKAIEVRSLENNVLRTKSCISTVD